MAEHVDNGDTRQRVLEAAGEVFAEKGFEKATIREIVERAGANLNAVNYYFRDKKGLYFALFEEANERACRSEQDAFEQMRALPPEQRLRAHLRHMFRHLVLCRRMPWQARLMAREMIEPTWMLDVLVKQFIRPRFEGLACIVRDLMPAGTSDLTVRLCTESIVAQVVHMAHARGVINQLVPELKYDADGVEAMVEHVAMFSLAAVRNLASEERSL